MTIARVSCVVCCMVYLNWINVLLCWLPKAPNKLGDNAWIFMRSVAMLFGFGRWNWRKYFAFWSPVVGKYPYMFYSDLFLIASMNMCSNTTHVSKRSPRAKIAYDFTPFTWCIKRPVYPMHYTTLVKPVSKYIETEPNNGITTVAHRITPAYTCFLCFAMYHYMLFDDELCRRITECILYKKEIYSKCIACYICITLLRKIND